MVTYGRVYALFTHIKDRSFGRRAVYRGGMAAMAIELYLIGILNVWADKSSVAWTVAILTLVWTYTFQLSAGQLGKSLKVSPENVS